MNIKVNGKEVTLAKEITVSELLMLQQVEMPQYVTVQINEQIIDRENFIRLF